MKCPRCEEQVTTVDEHVRPADEWTQQLGEWTCRGLETPAEALRRIARDGLGGRKENP